LQVGRTPLCRRSGRCRRRPSDLLAPAAARPMQRFLSLDLSVTGPSPCKGPTLRP
jgi:hypothetical protein